MYKQDIKYKQGIKSIFWRSSKISLLIYHFLRLMLVHTEYLFYSISQQYLVYITVKPFQIDELTSMAMTRYRTQIWVKLRENRLKDDSWMDYHRFCPSIFPGDSVFIRGSDGTWSRNIIDHIGAQLVEMKIYLMLSCYGSYLLWRILISGTS